MNRRPDPRPRRRRMAQFHLDVTVLTDRFVSFSPCMVRAFFLVAVAFCFDLLYYYLVVIDTTHLIGDFIMADKVSLFSAEERSWLKYALASQKAIIERKIRGELSADVRNIRNAELEKLAALTVKVDNV